MASGGGGGGVGGRARGSRNSGGGGGGAKTPSPFVIRPFILHTIASVMVGRHAPTATLLRFNVCRHTPTTQVPISHVIPYIDLGAILTLLLRTLR